VFPSAIKLTVMHNKCLCVVAQSIVNVHIGNEVRLHLSLRSQLWS